MGMVSSLAFLYLLMLDPFGNLPFFVSKLKNFSPDRYRKIVLRESFFALFVMMFFVVSGGVLIRLMNISEPVIKTGGGVILLLIGIKMVFSTFAADEEDDGQEPFLVPLAIPMICGPGTIAMLITERSRGIPLVLIIAALLFAWAVSLIILLCGRILLNKLGRRVLDAMESLMGLLLVSVATGMILYGIAEFYGIGG